MPKEASGPVEIRDSLKSPPQTLKTNPKVAIYMRVSMGEQSFASQEKVLLEYCGRNRWRDPEIFKEKKSGAKANRTALGNLMEGVRAGRFDLVLVYKLDRFGRSTLHLLQLIEELKTRGVAFISATEPINTSDENPSSGLILDMFAAFARHGRVQTVERINAGLNAAKARGVKLGRRRRNDDKIEKLFLLAKTYKTQTGVNPAKDLADQTGLTRQYVHKLLKDRRAGPAGRVLIRSGK